MVFERAADASISLELHFNSKMASVESSFPNSAQDRHVTYLIALLCFLSPVFLDLKRENPFEIAFLSLMPGLCDASEMLPETAFLGTSSLMIPPFSSEFTVQRAAPFQSAKD